MLTLKEIKEWIVKIWKPSIDRINLRLNDVAGGNGNRSSFTPANYTPKDESIEGHLEGIDDALGSNRCFSIAMSIALG